jgi:uroporphyrinogen decarboxylase
MIDGRGGTEFLETKRMLYQRPELLHHILETNAQAVSSYLSAQIEAGVQAVMLFDTWGGTLTGEAFREFSLRYMEQVFRHLPMESAGERIPRIVFTKGGGEWLERLAQCGADAVGLDWTVDIAQARARVGERVALQGNLDPAVLFASPEVIRREAIRVLAGFGHGSGHVFNLGHGISQYTPAEHVAALVETVHSESVRFH